MDHLLVAILAASIFVAAVLYSSVGHAGASGYLAVMALAGLAEDVMKPTALVLNILVAAVATTKFYRAGWFVWRLFWPFAVTSIPLAFVGGAIKLPGIYYKPIAGLVLIFAAVRLLIARGETNRGGELKRLPLVPALFAGAGIGLLSGLTGVGGGIFLSPLLLFAGWAQTRESAGVSAAFILVNSISGLLGHYASVSQVPLAAIWWGVAALAGGWIGSELGSKRLKTVWLRRLLGVVLMIAGFKLMLTELTRSPDSSIPKKSGQLIKQRTENFL